MIENAHVETASFIWLIVGAVLWIAVPMAIAIIWKLKKKRAYYVHFGRGSHLLAFRSDP